MNHDQANPEDMVESEPPEELDDVDTVEDVAKEVEDDEADEEEEIEQTESQEDGDRVKDKEVEAKKPLQMIGVQLLKDSDEVTSKKRRKKLSRISVEVRKIVMVLYFSLHLSYKGSSHKNHFSIISLQFLF